MSLKCLILFFSLLTLVTSQGSCPTNELFPIRAMDNATGALFSHSFGNTITNAGIGNADLASLLDLSWTGDTLEILPTAAFGDHYDDTGIRDLLSDSSDFSDGLTLEFDGGSTLNCLLGIVFTDGNNKPPEFTVSTPLSFRIPSTWDTSIALNWDFESPLNVTDRDYDLSNTGFSIIPDPAHPEMRGTAIYQGEQKTDSMTRRHAYFVQLFIDPPLAKGTTSYQISASDGFHTPPSQLTVEVEVYAENNHAPVFPDAGFHYDLDTIPNVGFELEPPITATDPDDPTTDITYDVQVDDDILEIDSNGKLKIVKDVTALDGQIIEAEVTATEDNSDGKSTKVKVTLHIPNIPPPKVPKFTQPYYHTMLTDLPASGESLTTVQADDEDGDAVAYALGSDAPGFLDIDDTSGQISFNTDIDTDTDLGDYKENGVIIFTVTATVGGGPTVECTVMAAFPLDKLNPPGSTTDAGTCPPCEATTELPCSTEANTCPPCEATTEFSCSTEANTCPPCEFTTDVTCAPCEATTTELTCPTEGSTCPPCEATTELSCSTEANTCPPCEATTDVTCAPDATTCPACECEGTTEITPCSTESSSCPPCEGTTESSTCAPCECEGTTTEMSCPTDPSPCPTDSTSSTTDSSGEITDPGDSSTASSQSTTSDSGSCPPCSTECPSTNEPVTCPEAPVTSDSPCITDPTTECPPCSTECPPGTGPGDDTCPPCSTPPPEGETCPPCDEDSSNEPCNPEDDDDENCSKTGLVVALIVTSVLSAASILVGGYLLWLLRKATLDPMKMPRDSIIPELDRVGSGKDFGRNDGYEVLDDTNVSPDESRGAFNPSFTMEEGGDGSIGEYATPSSIAEVPPPEPQPSHVQFQPEVVEVEPPPATTPAQPKSIMKTPKEIEPDYEEAPETTAQNEPKDNSSRERKQSRVLFEDDYQEPEEEAGVNNQDEQNGDSSDDSEDERL